MESHDPLPEFVVGDDVCLTADPSITVHILEVIPGKPENRYRVFQNGRRVAYYASQLQATAPVPDTREIVPLTAFHAYLTALYLNHPGLANLYSLHAARVNFVPYQFKPVLKFIRSDRPRLLIADEVGVGKTIEAGLILRELQSRKDITTVLVICPKPLVTESKWQLELKRFDEQFEHLDGPTLRQCIAETDLEGAWPARYAKAIIPFSLFDSELLHGSATRKKQRIGLRDLDPPPHFDLVIVDEAHHLRNTGTFVHEGVRFFCDHAEAVVFLSATPLQLENRDLFVLLNMLRPDLVVDEPSFQHMAEPNMHINRAIEVARAAHDGWQTDVLDALDQAVTTAWGQALLQPNPDFQRLVHHLAQERLSSIARVHVIRDLEHLHTFAGIINRTRRRDIGTFTTRQPETVEVDFTLQQRQLHDDLLDVLAQMLSYTHGHRSVKFLTSTIRRRAASCLYGLAPFLRDLLQRRFERLQEDTDDNDEELEWSIVQSIQAQIQSILQQVDNLDPYDPKLEALLKIVYQKQAMPNNKLLLFTSFKHTLSYLHTQLCQTGIRVEMIYGGTPDTERKSLRERFQLPADNPQALDMLLSSEVGCEGLDYQFCDCLVNYDIPWNPMRVEQRIGRIDRYGQESEVVAIYNFVTPGTVDFDIYHRCLVRIGIFHHTVGGSEEILGTITRELRAVAENLSLTETQRQVRLQQIEDNQIRHIKDQRELEERQAELFGITLSMQEAMQEELANAQNFWLSPWGLQNLINHYLHERCGFGEYILGEKAQKTLRLSQEARSRLLEDYRQLPRQQAPFVRDWEKWLKGADYRLALTFDAEYAANKRDITFITPIHPLAQQAARMHEVEQEVYTVLQVQDEEIAPGNYPFAIYRWHKRGIREDVMVQPVCTDPLITARFLELLKHAEQCNAPQVSLPDTDLFDALDTQHYHLWSIARAEHQEFTQRLAQHRRESLQTSHQARLNLLHEQVAQATDERIQRMRQSQIASAEADVHRHLAEIDAAATQSDIIMQPIAFGILVIERT
jgi:superfamily II DNA or RNA helicase